MSQLVETDQEMRDALLREVLDIMCGASNIITSAKVYRDELPINSWIQVDLKKSSKRALKLIHLCTVFVEEEGSYSNESFRTCFEQLKKKYKKQKNRWEHWESSAKRMLKERNSEVF
jgi:hypothetical protein